MNIPVLIVSCVLFFYFGIRFYSKRLGKIIGVDPSRKTPAHTKYDGVDYVPAKHWTVLFGHHFASIAGAAPIVGPIIAVSIWGWAPALLWVVLGTIFIGGMHDFFSLMISVKHDGASISDITKRCVSEKAKTVFLMFVWLTLILIIAVFVNICAKTFIAKPEIVLPSIGLVPVAVIVGFLLYKLKLHQPTVTILGLGMLAALMYLGKVFPIGLGGNPLVAWSIILLLYSLLASVTPVQTLLQPRDYLASFLLFFGLLFGYLGLIISGPSITLPAFVANRAKDVLPLWPFLFVTVACGAISGFHSIVASGTTSKQLSNERNGRMIGYGGMIAEGVLSAMTIMIIIVAFKNIGVLKDMIYKGSGPIGVFGTAYGSVTSSFLGGYGEIFAVIVLNAFILTTLDTATRIGRYVTQELFKIPNRYLATILVVLLSGWLALSDKWKDIWPIFGSANQLIAALALIVISSWLLMKGRKIIYTLLPTLFMLATTVGALVLKIKEYLGSNELVLMVISIVLLGLAVFIFFEAVWQTKDLMKKRLRNA